MFARLLMEVTGVGLLLCIPVLADSPVDALSWAMTCSIGLAVGVATRTALVRDHAGPILPSDPAEQGVVRAWYVGGILAGQVFICGFSGFLVARSFGFDGATTGFGLAMLAASGLLACWRPTISERAKRWRTVLTVLAALVWAVWPASISPTEVLVAAGHPGVLPTALLLFVSVVGWETRSSWSRAEHRDGRKALAPVFVVVLVLGAGLICLRLVRAGGDLGPAAPALAVPIGLLAISYCRTNLVAAARLAAEFRAKPPDSVRPPMVAAAVAPVAATLLAAGLFGWPIGYFLFGPASMTLGIFCWLAGRVTANPQASPGARSAGLIAICGLLALSPALGPAILFPVLVGAAVFGWLTPRGASSRLTPHSTTQP